ncbi:MAG: DUF1800 domain-containing protein [Candidatus Saccharibacteria bacterium]|nr:DUF1800 domain-containing protein [Pseudorhodobacter sp.]
MEPASLIEQIRFGYGPRAGQGVAQGFEADRVMAQLSADDPRGKAWDRPTLAERYALFDQYRVEKDSAAGVQPVTALALKAMQVADIETFVARPAFADAGFVERLVNLWANRITISNASGAVARYMQNFRDEAIRPHIAGRYGDMLKATLWHPGMQFYLTQSGSVGPDSPAGKKKRRGLNENLAREFLELHSMRVGYSQDDVTALAMLLAGMASDEKGVRVDPRRVQPGDKVILGQTFTDDDPMAQINRLVDYVALRPETAQNVAHFMVRHFLNDEPPADLVASLARTYMATEGDLPALYRVLLEHPAARAPAREKLRTPQEFAAATIRLIGIEPTGPDFDKLLRKIPNAMTAMGQPPFRALRPDGWPEVSEGWMTPPMMAARIDWAVDMARRAGNGVDPQAMVMVALGETASPLLMRAVGGAEQRWEGLAVLLGSPEFSRR